jgi:hypothetical protein
MYEKKRRQAYIIFNNEGPNEYKGNCGQEYHRRDNSDRFEHLDDIR